MPLGWRRRCRHRPSAPDRRRSRPHCWRGRGLSPPRLRPADVPAGIAERYSSVQARASRPRRMHPARWRGAAARDMVRGSAPCLFPVPDHGSHSPDWRRHAPCTSPLRGKVARRMAQRTAPAVGERSLGRQTVGAVGRTRLRPGGDMSCPTSGPRFRIGPFSRVGEGSAAVDRQHLAGDAVARAGGEVKAVAMRLAWGRRISVGAVARSRVHVRKNTPAWWRGAVGAREALCLSPLPDHGSTSSPGLAKVTPPSTVSTSPTT